MNVYDDSLVVDLLGPEVDVAICAAREYDFRPYWRSLSHSTEFSPWHFNYSPQGSVEATLAEHKDWAGLWRLFCEAVDVPPGAEVLRLYMNANPFGCDGDIHTDDRNPDGVTICFYVHSMWESNWGGETALFDSDGEICRAVLPKPGRVFAFRGKTSHSARPTSRLATAMRIVMVVKMRNWSSDWPIKER